MSDKFLANALFAGAVVLLFTGIPGRIAQQLFNVSSEGAFFVTWIVFPVTSLALVMAVVLATHRRAPDLQK